jgi:hypothetical protein
VALALFVSACGFPKYEFGASGASGASGSGAEIGGSAGSSAGSATGGDAGTGGGASGSGGTAMGGAAGDSGGLPECTIASAGMDAGSNATAPTHCFNNKKDGDETDVDCGGPSCRACYGPTREACQHDTDCISGSCMASTCDPLFELQAETVVAVSSTNTLQFLLRLQFLNPEPQANASLKDIAIRYYFSRAAGDVADPIVPYATIATLDSMDVGQQTEWNIVRVLPMNSLTDSYLEVTFTTSRSMLLNDTLELTQSIQDGSASGGMFNQNANYSYANQTTYADNTKIAVYYKGELVWGTPPTFDRPEQCFYTAVNFAGNAFSAQGLDYRAGSDPIVEFSGEVFHTNTTPFPPTDSAYLPMLESALVLVDGQNATLSVPNGSYWLYAYLISGDGAETAQFFAQSNELDTFCAETVGAAPAWAKVGPYPVTVSNQKLVLSSSGTLRVAGLELYAAAQCSA